MSKTIRELLVEQIDSQNAHVDFRQAVEGVSYKQAGSKVEGIPHTIWELVEHMRISQHDILEFCRNPDYEAPDWPDDYWPENSSPNSEQAFTQSVRSISKGLEEMQAIISTPENDLQTPLPHGDGQTLFREAMLIVDHNAYHIGQIVQIRRLLGIW